LPNIFKLYGNLDKANKINPQGMNLSLYV